MSLEEVLEMAVLWLSCGWEGTVEKWLQHFQEEGCMPRLTTSVLPPRILKALAQFQGHLGRGVPIGLYHVGLFVIEESFQA